MGSLAKGLGRGAPRQVVLMQARSVPRTGSARCCWLDRSLLWLLVGRSGILEADKSPGVDWAREIDSRPL